MTTEEINRLESTALKYFASYKTKEENPGFISITPKQFELFSWIDSKPEMQQILGAVFVNYRNNDDTSYRWPDGTQSPEKTHWDSEKKEYVLKDLNIATSGMLSAGALYVSSLITDDPQQQIAFAGMITNFTNFLPGPEDELKMDFEMAEGGDISPMEAHVFSTEPGPEISLSNLGEFKILLGQLVTAVEESY